MSQERRFAKGLSRPGMAAQVRETVSQTIRDNSNLTKARLIEPIDYETYIVKNKTILQNDPHREMVTFPHDDVSQSTLPRRLRTVRSSVPPNWEKDTTSLLVKESINTYTSDWHVVHYKYNNFGGDYSQLPRSVDSPQKSLPQHVFEVDTESDDKEDSGGQKTVSLHITKQGWLYKGPDSGQESGIISFTKSFKRRYFYLKQQADTTYVLEFHKDDKKLEARGSIFLDSAVNVIKGSRRGKQVFELHMQDKSVYVLGAEHDNELDEWVAVLKKVIHNNESQQRFHREGDTSSPSKMETMRESLEHSMNPELQKYARETDSLLAQQRREGRQNIFTIYPDMQHHVPHDDSDEDADSYKEHFGTRFILRCEDLTMRLQANVAEDGKEEKLSNPEPFFISLVLYDAKENRKISEDFHYDPNQRHIRDMVPKDIIDAVDKLNSVNGAQSFQPDLGDLDEKWLTYSKQCIFSVTTKHPEIYLVAKKKKVPTATLR